jgi:hypothetical protein
MRARESKEIIRQGEPGIFHCPNRVVRRTRAQVAEYAAQKRFRRGKDHDA